MTTPLPPDRPEPDPKPPYPEETPSAMPTERPVILETAIGPVEVGYDGRPLDGRILALDTETTLDHEFVLLAASNGVRRVIVPYGQLHAFIHDHCDRIWVFHNVAFDFHVLDTVLGDDVMWKMVEQHRLHDTMLLAQLIKIGKLGDPRGVDDQLGSTVRLEELARLLTDVPIDKAVDERYRMHYAEIIDRDLAEVAREEPGWFDYAARDAEATWYLFDRLIPMAIELTARHGVPDETHRKFGFLSEQVQIRGAIALAAVERHGLAVDRAYSEQRHAELNKEMIAAACRLDHEIAVDDQLAALGPPLTPSETEVFERTVGGQFKLNHKALHALLEAIAQRRGVDVPTTPDGDTVSRKATDWAHLRDVEAVIDAWLALEELGKSLQFVLRDRDHVYPRYVPLTGTGRVSCRSPNVQQLPRKGGIREAYGARPGHVLIGADYKNLELRTLAQECLNRQGYSHLREAFEAGVDPHVVTAASILGMTLPEFEALEQTDPHRYAECRQAAKAANFGFPGGLGLATFIKLSAANYGVVFSQEQAQVIRDAWTKAYPEVAEYLQIDGMQRIADAIGCDVETLWDRVDFTRERPGWMPQAIQRVLQGLPKKTGEPYARRFVEGVWDGLAAVASDPLFTQMAATRRLLPHQLQNLTSEVAVTSTGRVRGGCTYCSARNTPFQGLAADGAKLALYDLTRRGYRVVAFVHDEIWIEVPEDSDLDAAAAQLEASMVSGMQVVCPDIVIDVPPPAASYVLSKDAEPVFDDRGRLVPWRPAGSVASASGETEGQA